TAMMFILSGGALFFLAGVRLWKFGLVIASVCTAFPILWSKLHTYQQNRILIFLDPDLDPSKTGYHLSQSKIALGSGGIFGKGFMQGSQSHLDFLPEKQTDFIFTMFAEEFGLVGCIFLLFLYALVIAYGYKVASQSRSQFGRLLALSMSNMLFLYVFINTGMVMGLLPVVGVPLPLMSYGGTAMLTLMMGIGMIFSVKIHQDHRIGRF
ncbi:MAG TPA: FtsW/RodA/SpoVE family cell cycle protein, partial [Bdellovibrionota bacterium]|nr:FtsW/RodA/SpoVE family cell cycle protein [Bdellovibrionota bacterium]